MSAHIPPVKYRWCKLQTSEVMRTPLQILFLILVTDLPPSIALGMEPGDFRQPLRGTYLAGFMSFGVCCIYCIHTI